MVALRETDSPLATVRRLIVEYDLHSESVPVDLRPLNALFVPIYDDHPDATSYVVPPADGGTISERHPAYVVLSSTRLSGYDPHVAYAHEIAHALLRHFGSIRMQTVNQWFHDRQEREAWQIAAVLLIPNRLIYESGFWDWSKEHIAAACQVPLWLVEMYPN